VKKATWRSPTDAADDLVAQHVAALGCEDCADELCRYHQGYREGCLVLLLKAVAG